jgi:hypothetical protein
LASCTGLISEIFVLAIELAEVAFAEGTVGEKVAVGTIKVLGHLFLAFIPWWAALPIHLLYDLIGTRWIFRGMKAVATYVKGDFTNEVLDAWETICHKIERFRHTRYTAENSTVEMGELDTNDADSWPIASVPIHQMEFTEEQLSAFRENEAVDLSLEIDGQKVPLQAGELNQALRLFKPSRQVAYPLLCSDFTQDMALTTNSPATFLSAAIFRYANAPPFTGSNWLIVPILEELKDSCAALTPLTTSEFLKPTREVATAQGGSLPKSSRRRGSLA